MTQRARVSQMAFAAAFLASSAVHASPLARATAMGDAYSAFSAGAEGMWWNPAALGSQLIFSTDLGIGMSAGNNVLTLTTAQDLTGNDKAAKNAVYAKVDKAGGLQADLRGGGGLALAFNVPSAGSFGVGVTPQAYAAIKKLTPDAIRFMTGYKPEAPADWQDAAAMAGQQYVLTGKADAAGFTEVGIGYARDLPAPMPGLDISAGLTLKYLQGIAVAYGDLDENLTIGTAPTGKGITYGTGTKGSGFGADLGVKAGLFGIAKGAIVLRNVATKIHFTGTEEYKGSLDMTTGAFGVAKTVGTHDVTLPFTVLVGVGGSVPLVGTSVGGEVEADTTNSFTRLHLGAEQSLGGLFAIRAGFVTGAGPYDSMVTFGIGLHVIVAGIDLGGGIPVGGSGLTGASTALSIFVSF